MLLRILDTLADRVRHFARLAESEADRSVAVTHNHQCGKLHHTAALYRLADTVDGNQVLFQFGVVRVNSVQSVLLLFLRI